MVTEEELNRVAEFYQVIHQDIKFMWKMYCKIDIPIKTRLSFEKYCDIVMKKEQVLTIREVLTDD